MLLQCKAKQQGYGVGRGRGAVHDGVKRRWAAGVEGAGGRAGAAASERAGDAQRAQRGLRPGPHAGCHRQWAARRLGQQ